MMDYECASESFGRKSNRLPSSPSSSTAM